MLETEAECELIFEKLKSKVSENFWSSEFQIDSSLFNTISVVKENIEQQEVYLKQINVYVYYRINKNFTEFYKIVQKMNRFDTKAQSILANIELIRNQFSNSKLMIKTDIYSTQSKIRRKIMLKEVLKIFETLKYIDKANNTIKNLFEKTDFKKISELLVVLKNGFDEKLRKIKVFENKFEEINKLKQSVIESLVKMALNQIENHASVFLKEFKEYIANFADNQETVFNMETNASDLESVHSILIELRMINEINLSSEVSSNFFELFHRFNREIIADINKQLVFKKPSINLLKSYKNLAKILYRSYKSIFSFENDKEVIQSIINVLTKNTNSFFKKVFDVFDLHMIGQEQILEFLDVIISFSSVFQSETDSVFWQLQLYFKKLILNAKQQSNFQIVKKAMENELWTPVEISEENQGILRSLLEGQNFELFGRFVKIGETKYLMSSSFIVLFVYFNELIVFQEHIGNIGSEFFTKTEEALKLYLFNSENLLLKAVAIKYNKITKINTKMLGLIISIVGVTNSISWNYDEKFHEEK